jgi:hypothetical protein
MNGSPSDFSFMVESMQRCLDQSHMLHVTTANWDNYKIPFFQKHRTYDGIVAGGERVFTEIESVLNQQSQLTHFSMIGHSLGGLYARYVIGKLKSRGWFDRLQARYFITIATPHLGSRQLTRLLPTSFVEWTATHLIGPTGDQLLYQDQVFNEQDLGVEQDPQRLPVLLQLCQEPYLSALRSFQHRFAFANAFHDRTVSFCTSAICTRNVLRAFQADQLQANYLLHPHFKSLIDVDNILRDQALLRIRDDPLLTDQLQLLQNGVDIDDIVLPQQLPSTFQQSPALRISFSALSAVKWRRIAVLDRPFLAHTDIIVRSIMMNAWSAGHDVVEYICLLLVDQL